MTLFYLTFGSYMTSAHRIYIRNSGSSFFLKKILFRKSQSILPCRSLHDNPAESPRLGEGRESRLISPRDHLFFILSLEAISKGTYVGDLFL